MQTKIDVKEDNQVISLIFYSVKEKRPPTMDYDVFQKLEKILDDIERALNKEPIKPRCLVVRSKSKKFFIAGANINVLKTLDHETIKTWVTTGHRVLNRIEALPIPVIALVDGYALGGGLELAMACDFIYATDKSSFGQPETKLGLVSGWGGSYRLAKRVGLAQAKELFYTGRIIDSKKAFELGLINFTGDEEKVGAKLEKTVQELVANSAFAVSEIKKILNRTEYSTIIDNCRHESDSSVGCYENVDSINRINKFVNKKN